MSYGFFCFPLWRGIKGDNDFSKSSPLPPSKGGEANRLLLIPQYLPFLHHALQAL
jgi:hypothetical protein